MIHILNQKWCQRVWNTKWSYVSISQNQLVCITQNPVCRPIPPNSLTFQILSRFDSFSKWRPDYYMYLQIMSYNFNNKFITELPCAELTRPEVSLLWLWSSKQSSLVNSKLSIIVRHIWYISSQDEQFVKFVISSKISSLWSSSSCSSVKWSLVNSYSYSQTCVFQTPCDLAMWSVLIMEVHVSGLMCKFTKLSCHYWLKLLVEGERTSEKSSKIRYISSII